MMDPLIALHQWLNGGMPDGVKSAADLPSVLSLLSTEFVFRLVHALMPGHGNSLLVPSGDKPHSGLLKTEI
jgi:hypothetical protein